MEWVISVSKQPQLDGKQAWSAYVKEESHTAVIGASDDSSEALGNLLASVKDFIAISEGAAKYGDSSAVEKP